jgi:hypothetical protein
MNDTGLGILVIVIAIAVIWSSLAHIAQKRRRERLMAKYGDPQIVEAIIRRQVWQGMTKEQLLDSWGAPVDTSNKVFKTKIRETYKYNQTGRNRFRSRVMLENEIVIGWQDGN